MQININSNMLPAKNAHVTIKARKIIHVDAELERAPEQCLQVRTGISPIFILLANVLPLDILLAHHGHLLFCIHCLR